MHHELALIPASAPTMAPSQTIRGYVPELYDHYESLADYLKPRPVLPENRGWFNEWMANTRTIEIGGKTPNDVYRCVKHGWPEGAQTLLETIGTLAAVARATTIRRVLCRDGHGDEYDMHRAMSGGFDKAWTRRKRGHRPAMRGVTICVDLTYSMNSVGLNAPFWRGAAALSVADALQTAGYAVEIIAFEVGNTPCPQVGWFQTSVMLKRAHEPLDIEKLAAALALPGFSRVFCFRKYAEIGSPCRGFGSVAPMRIEKLDLENPISVTLDILDRRSCLDWIKETIKRVTGDDAQFE